MSLTKAFEEFQLGGSRQPAGFDELVISYHLPNYVIFHTDKHFPKNDQTCMPPIYHDAKSNMISDEEVAITGPDVILETNNDIILKSPIIGEIVVKAGIRVLSSDLFKFGPLSINMKFYNDIQLTYFTEPVFNRKLRLLGQYFDNVIMTGMESKEGRALCCSKGILSFMSVERVKNSNNYKQNFVSPHTARSNIIKGNIYAYEANVMCENEEFREMLYSISPAIIHTTKDNTTPLKFASFDFQIERDKTEKFYKFVNDKFSRHNPKIELLTYDIKSGFDATYHNMIFVIGQTKGDLADINKMYDERLIESPATL